MTLVAFDFDGTLSDSEMTVLLGRRVDRVGVREASGRSDRASVADEMAAITERAMNDEIDYAESLRSRVALLEGLHEDDVAAAFDAVRLREGAAGVLADLRERGHAVVILTGGFERGVRAALDAAGVGVDGIGSNTLSVADGRLTGDVDGPLIEGTKDDALMAAAEEHGATIAETVAVGDGANDLPMLEAAGLAVGFDPKPAVEDACDVTVSSFAELRDLFERRGLL